VPAGKGVDLERRGRGIGEEEAVYLRVWLDVFFGGETVQRH